MSLIKKKIVEKILEHLEADSRLLTDSALEAREAATHEESKAEDKYDTRGLEASYLAGAQAKRAVELQQLIHVFKTIELKDYNSSEPIGLTALVEVQTQDKKSTYFIVPKGSGLTVKLDGKSIQVISPSSVVGEALVGRNSGDLFEVEIQKQMREYEILSVA